MKDRQNTINGWILFAGIVALGGTVVAGEIFKGERPEHMGYPIEGVEVEGGAAEAEKPIAFYLASADPAKGEQVFKKCAACHNADPGGANALGPALATHAMFPGGTNVEFAHVESPERIRILIWERGVGPTTSSGTGTAASAVAAAAHGGAGRVVDVVAPGGTQRVEWNDDGVYLTGWAALVLDGEWTGAIA